MESTLQYCPRCSITFRPISCLSPAPQLIIPTPLAGSREPPRQRNFANISLPRSVPFSRAITICFTTQSNASSLPSAPGYKRSAGFLNATEQQRYIISENGEDYALVSGRKQTTLDTLYECFQMISWLAKLGILMVYICTLLFVDCLIWTDSFRIGCWIL
jgi:hypothetical protein